jgi:hypothetical protein
MTQWMLYKRGHKYYTIGSTVTMYMLSELHYRQNSNYVYSIAGVIISLQYVTNKMALPPRVQDSEWSERSEVDDIELEKTRKRGSKR